MIDKVPRNVASAIKWLRDRVYNWDSSKIYIPLKHKSGDYDFVLAVDGKLKVITISLCHLDELVPKLEEYFQYGTWDNHEYGYFCGGNSIVTNENVNLTGKIFRIDYRPDTRGNRDWGAINEFRRCVDKSCGWTTVPRPPQNNYIVWTTGMFNDGPSKWLKIS